VLSSQSDTLARSFFDRQAAAWADRYQSPTYRQRQQLISKIIQQQVLRLSRPVGTIKVLDFGCGSGVLLKDAANLGLQVTGVDHSKAMIDAAHEQLSGFGKHVNLEWLQSSSGQGNYERETYDIVICLSVLEFVPGIDSLLFRLCARTATGGILVVSVPNRQSWLRAIEKFIFRHPRIFQRFSALDHLTGSDSYLSHQAHQLTRNQLLNMVQRQGLREESHRFHIAPAWLRSVEFMKRVGMMLIMTFRK